MNKTGLSKNLYIGDEVIQQIRQEMMESALRLIFG